MIQEIEPGTEGLVYVHHYRLLDNDPEGAEYVGSEVTVRDNPTPYITGDGEEDIASMFEQNDFIDMDDTLDSIFNDNIIRDLP